MFGTAINNKGKREKNKKVKEGPCIFPFTYKWTEHNKCVVTDKGSICATSLTNAKRRTLKTYGYCVKKRPDKTKTTIKTTKKPNKTLKLIKKAKNKKVKNKKITLKRITLKKIDKTRSKNIKAKLIVIKMPRKIKIKRSAKQQAKQSAAAARQSTGTGLNAQLIDMLEKLEALMNLRGEPFRARAYHKAAESIMLYQKPITDVNVLKGVPSIGKTILAKFNEFVKTGTLEVLDRAKNNPVYLFPKIYGIGPKKAQKLVDAGITSIADLRKQQANVLNPTQITGLRYFEDILKRIPRSEIDEYGIILETVFSKLKPKGSRFEIVGSYRRGAKTSGDIDIIITNSRDDKSIFANFIKALQDEGILIELLTKGKTKSLTIGKLPNLTPRRLDFMYASPTEFAFAILYFTGSKAFNVVMRQRALTLGYSMNEHGLYKMQGKNKGPKLNILFPTERSIFEFLGLEFKTPIERIDGRAIVLKSAPVKVKAPVLVKAQ